MRHQRPPLTFADTAAGPPSRPLASVEDPRKILHEYRPWRKVRYLAQELGVDATELWTLIKQQRLATWRTIDVPRHEGGRFGFCLPESLLEPLLVIDRSTGVDPAAPSRGRTLRKRLLAISTDNELLARRRISSAMNEAAESSIMEGAASTRRDAIDLLRSGRKPVSIAERMIVNNYLAMQQIKQWLDRDLSTEMLLELHELLAADSIDVPGGVGRLRLASEHVHVEDTRTGDTIFTPPPAESLADLLRAVCAFANQEHSGADFIHPIAKSAILHFLVGYAHPFVDGNGRTARAVFYWHALRHGYAIMEHLSISEIIRKGFARYPQAYVDCELDDGDLTYFIAYHLDIIQQALDRLADYIETERERIRQSERFLSLAKGLNLRQRLLLEHALRHPLTQYTVKSHANSNGIVLATSRADLDELVRLRLMTTSKKGKQVLYLAAPTLENRLNRARAAR